MISEQLAAFTADLAPATIPPEVVCRAKYLMLDAIGIAFASTTFEFARKTIDALRAFGAGDSAVIGFPQSLSLRDAVLANGVLAHGLDYDDTHLAGVVHATSSALPTALGAAAANGKSGADMLCAYIAGMETAARLGTVAGGELNQLGFHPTGVIAAFACALIAGKLYGLTREQLVMAQGIVLSMAAGTREYSSDGSWSKRLHPGWAGACGITAAVLARGGYTGPRSAYEGRFGLYATHLGADLSKWDIGAATRDLGSVWETMQVAIKPFPACQLSIACLDAAIAIAKKHDVQPNDIADIEALVPPHAVKIVCEPVDHRRRPQSSYAAQFSIQFGVACALILRKFGLAELERYRDPDILALADKVRYRVDPHTGYPKHFSGEVIVRLKNGDCFAQREQVNRGAADNPVSDEDIAAKFMDNACMALPRSTAESIKERILSLDRVRDVREFASKLNDSGGCRDGGEHIAQNKTHDP